MLIDGDSHFYEYPSLWRDHLSSADAHLALSVEADELGYSHLSYAGRHLYFVVPTFPMDPSASGEVRARRAAGLPCAKDMYEHVPRNYWDIEARTELADAWGVDSTILFPQFQGMIDSLLRTEAAAAHANMGAWNRWAVEVTEQTKGRLCPVGHIRLDADVEWAVRQIEQLGAGGCRFAMFVPGLVGGKPPSHPDNAVVWRSFIQHKVTPIWHINPGHRYAVANIAEWESTGNGGFSPATGMFLNVASQLALSDMIFNGVFDRHHDLHVVLAELGIDWIPTFLAEMDLREATVAKQQGRQRGASYRRPSEIFRDHVTSVVSCPTDRDIALLLETRGAGLAYGSDYPHGCSPAEPVAHIRAEIEGTLDEEQQAAFFGGRLAALLD
jgi:predicted TIM-barrel fold metal-dependent hydrolase